MVGLEVPQLAQAVSLPGPCPEERVALQVASSLKHKNSQWDSKNANISPLQPNAIKLAKRILFFLY